MVASAEVPYIVGFVFGYSLAVVSTILRLHHRYQRQQLWWDDLWAGVALFTAMYIFFSYEVVTWSIGGSQGLSPRLRSFLAWSQFWAHTSTIWSSRMSLQTTVVNFLPPGRNKTISKCAAGVLIIGWIASGIVKMFYNGTPIPMIPNPPWRKLPTLIDLVLAISATTWLVVWPAYIVMRMKLSRRVKRIIVFSFASAFVFLGLEIFHYVNVINTTYPVLRVSGHIELVACLIVANMVILMSALYQRFYPDADHRRDSRALGSTSSEEPDSGKTKLTTFSSVADPLTEFHSSDLHWSEAPPHSQGLRSGSQSWPEDSSNSGMNSTRGS